MNIFMNIFLILHLTFSKKNNVFYVTKRLTNRSCDLVDEILINEKILEKHFLDNLNFFKNEVLLLKYTKQQECFLGELNNEILLNYYIKLVGLIIKDEVIKITSSKKIDMESILFFENLHLQLDLSSIYADIKKFEMVYWKKENMFTLNLSHLISENYNDYYNPEIFEDILIIEKFSLILLKILSKTIKLLKDCLKIKIASILNINELIARVITEKIGCKSKFSNIMNVKKTNFHLIEWIINEDYLDNLNKMIQDIKKIQERNNINEGIVFFNIDMSWIDKFYISLFEDQDLSDEICNNIQSYESEEYMSKILDTVDFKYFLSSKKNFSFIYYTYNSDENLLIKQIQKEYIKIKQDINSNNKHSFSKKIKRFYDKKKKFHELVFEKRYEEFLTSRKKKINRINEHCFSEN